jgi:hypothetical protein
MKMLSAEEIFTEWHEKHLAAIRTVRRGKRLFEIEGTEEWKRLSIGQRTALQIFSNFSDGRPDRVSMLGVDMYNFFEGNSVGQTLTPDFLICLKLFLGDLE